MRFKAIIFDLDGTLLDTLKDIAESMNTVLKNLGFTTYRLEDYRYFVGEGIETLCRRVLPGSQRTSELVASCVKLMKNEYQKNWQNNTHPYPGISELLNELDKRKIKKTVLSNKPDEFTKIFVGQLLSDWHFEIVLGASSTIEKKPSPQGALYIAEKLKIRPQEFIYLGDSNIDMETAVAAGMYPVGALWGFRTADELIAAGAKRLIKTPEELLEVIYR